ncbi:Uncharacterised protein [Raoultella ornithinolytica]|nr:Uncharacterised protein [Raoultella ornithinolytica]
MTCQASAERQIPRLCMAPDPVSGAVAVLRVCGNHTSSASSGKTINIKSAPCQPKPASASGTTMAEPSAAAPPIVIE